MSNRGGYRIVNMRGYALTSGEEANVPGTFASVRNNYKKATLVSGLTVGDVEYPDFYAPFVEGESSFTTSVVIGGDTVDISVADGDDVTVTVTSPEPEPEP